MRRLRDMCILLGCYGLQRLIRIALKSINRRTLMENALFGDWGKAERAVGATFVATPIGDKCYRCKEVVVEGDVGEMVPHIGESPMLRPVHRECILLSIRGHDYGVCGCTNMAGLPTIRQAALELDRRMNQVKKGELWFGLGPNCKGVQ